MIHVANPLTVKGLTFTPEHGTDDDVAVDGSRFTSYRVTRDSRLDFDPHVATVTIYSDGETILIFDGTAPGTVANMRARANLRAAIASSGLDVSPISDWRFRD